MNSVSDITIYLYNNTHDNYLTREYYDWGKVVGFRKFRHIFPAVELYHNENNLANLIKGTVSQG